MDQIEIDPSFQKKVLKETQVKEDELIPFELPGNRRVYGQKLTKEQYQFIDELQKNENLDSLVIKGKLVVEKSTFSSQYCIIFMEDKQSQKDQWDAINDERFFDERAAYRLARDMLLFVEQVNNYKSNGLVMWMQLRNMKLVRKEKQYELRVFPIFGTHPRTREIQDLYLVPVEQLRNCKGASAVGEYELKSKPQPPLTPAQCVWIAMAFLNYLLAKKPLVEVQLPLSLEAYLEQLESSPNLFRKGQDAEFAAFLGKCLGEMEKRPKISAIQQFLQSKQDRSAIKKKEQNKEQNKEQTEEQTKEQVSQSIPKRVHKKAVKNEGFYRIEVCEWHKKKCIYMDESTQEVLCKVCVVERARGMEQ